MVYRPAKESDLAAICALIGAAIEAMEREGIFQWDSLYPARDDFLADINKSQLYVGELGGEIAVVFAVNREWDEQYRNGKWKCSDGEYRVLHRLCVAPKYQNRGIAGAALVHMENELRRKGVGSIRLDVFDRNPHALSLYRRHGYEKVGSALWRKGEFSLMEKRL